MTKETTYWINTDGERHIASGADLEQILADIAASEAKAKSDAIAEQAKESAKSTAEAKLAALGLTSDDLRALGL